MASGNGNGIKIPRWAIGTLVTLGFAFLCFWGMWNVARADVDNLKKDVDALKPLSAAVAVINNDIANIKGDIQQIKVSQQQMTSEQKAFQIEVQRDIKTLLAQRSR